MTKDLVLAKLTPMAPMLLLAGFALVAAVIWVPRGTDAPQIAAPSHKELDARLSSGSERLANLIAVTNERPVFHASRRPVPTAEAPKAAEPVLSLLGVIREDNAETLAFVKVSTTGTLYRVAEGETVGRWRILKIGVEESTVSKDGKAPFMLQIGG